MDLLNLGEIPPGTDLCTIPSALAPPGVHSSFHEPNPLKPVTITLSVVLTLLGIVFGLIRVYTNLIKISPGDILVLLAVLLNTGTGILTSVYVDYFQHQWNIPVCKINDRSFRQALLSFELLTILSLLAAKSATLLLFKDLFSVSRRLKIAIWGGIAFTVVLYTLSIIFTGYLYISEGSSEASLITAIVQGVASTSLDIYIFILPLRTIYRLNLSRKQKIQMMVVFLTAALGVAASIVSLVFRISSFTSDGNDLTYYTGLLLNFNLIEMNSALIISSTAAFAKFMRIIVIPWLNRLGTISSEFSSSAAAGFHEPNDMRNPNRPRTGRKQFFGSRGGSKRPKAFLVPQGDTWFLRSDTTRLDLETCQKTESDITASSE